jgi:hypothetical protein
MEEMRARFTYAGLQSPFSLVNYFSPDVVIHYRLGDKKKSFSELNLGIDGVVDPKNFRDILIRENLLNSPSIYVISDEPIIAQELLNSVKVIAHIAPTDNDIWSDIAFMAGARNAICSWSQVSQLAAVFNIFNGGKVFYANSSSTGFKPKWVIPGAIAFQPEFLQATHPIYQG